MTEKLAQAQMENAHKTPLDGVDFTGVGDSVGARLQALRKRFGLSQRELARRAEVTNSTLSMIEQGKVSPSVGSLEKILKAFPFSLQEFFSESLDLAPQVILAEDLIQMQRGQASFKVLPVSLGRKKDGVFLTEQVYPSGARIDSQWLVQSGFVGGIILSGTLELQLEGVKYQLNRGDGFNFSLHREHAFINNDKHECRVVCVSGGR